MIPVSPEAGAADQAIASGLQPRARVERFARRVVALVVDLVVALVLSLVLLVVFSFFAGSILSADQGLGILVVVPFVPVVFGLYFVVAHGRPAGRTVGKRFMSLRVCNARSAGPLGYRRALLRFVTQLVLFPATPILFGDRGFVVVALLIVDSVWPLVDPRGRALHDLVAGSFVIDDRPLRQATPAVDAQDVGRVTNAAVASSPTTFTPRRLPGNSPITRLGVLFVALFSTWYFALGGRSALEHSAGLPPEATAPAPSVLSTAPSPSDPALGRKEADQGHSHVAAGQPVIYARLPPTSGAHWPQPVAPVKAGTYEFQVRFEATTHNLEHGGIVIVYNGLSAVDTSALQDFVRKTIETTKYKKVLVEPYTDLFGARVTATAWDWRLDLQAFDAPSLTKFIQAHYDGSEAPEAGVAW